MLLLRTVVLLLLCVSVGLCATLAHYQTPAEEEEEAPAVIDGAVTAASLDAAEEEPAANSLFGNSLPAKILAVDKPAADKVADGATAKEPETDSDRPAGDTPALEVVPQKQPSSSPVEEGNDIRPVQTNRSLNRPMAHEDSSWSINSIRNSFQTVHGYFDSLVELVGGHNGVCQYRCRYGKSESLELTRSYVTEIHKCFSVLEVVLGVLRGSDR